MLGLHIVLVTLRGWFTISIELDNWNWRHSRGSTLLDFCVPRVAEGYLFRGYLPPRHELKSLYNYLIF